MAVPFLFCSVSSCCKIHKQIVAIYTDNLLFFIVTIQKKSIAKPLLNLLQNEI